eukprot:7391136-Prymnesium_polylepis.1
MAPPWSPDRPLASLTACSVRFAPLVTSNNRDFCSASKVAPSLSESTCKSIGPTMMGRPLSVNTAPGGMYSARDAFDGAALTTSRRWSADATVVNPSGAGMSGGIGGSGGGDG